MSTDSPTILVVDDEQHIRELLRMGLALQGFTVIEATNGKDALALAEADRPDLIVLDVMMPGLDGLETASRLRRATGQHRDTPLIFLTARDTVEDKVEGLRRGSDDYMTKPFSIEELVMRVHAILRRSGSSGATSKQLSFEDLSLDEDTREVWRGDNLIELTPTEFRLLHYLLSNARNVLTRDQILEHVWDYGFTSNASVLETYISYVRQKVDIVDPPLIHTVRGVGYSLRLPR